MGFKQGLLFILIIGFFTSCATFELSNEEINRLRYVSNAERYSTNRDEGIYELKIHNLNNSRTDKANKSKAFAVVFYNILYPKINSLDTRTVFRVSYNDNDAVESFHYTFSELVFLQKLGNNAEALFKGLGKGKEIKTDLIYSAECFDFEKELIKSNTGWRANESELLFLIGLSETSMNLCENNIDGFIFHYFHAELERTVLIYFTNEGKIVSLASMAKES